MPTQIWLLRHAETAIPGVFHGAESDVGLSERGLRMAECLGPYLARHQPAAVISSNMLRARLSAEPIARAAGLPLRIEPLLHERRVGNLLGLPVPSSGIGVWPETLQRWMAGDTGYAPEGAESFDELRQRILPVWDRLVQEFHDRSLIIVAHGVVCKVLLLSLLPGWSIADWNRLGPMRNLGVSELHLVDGVWHGIRLNELPEPLQHFQTMQHS